MNRLPARNSLSGESFADPYSHRPPATETPKRPADAVPCSGEVVRGFTLLPGQDASTCDWWPEFSEYFEQVEGFKPHPRDTHHKRLFEYFVEGAFRQPQQSQNQRILPDVDGNEWKDGTDSEGKEPRS